MQDRTTGDIHKDFVRHVTRFFDYHIPDYAYNIKIKLISFCEVWTPGFKLNVVKLPNDYNYPNNIDPNATWKDVFYSITGPSIGNITQVRDTIDITNFVIQDLQQGGVIVLAAVETEIPGRVSGLSLNISISYELKRQIYVQNDFQGGQIIAGLDTDTSIKIGNQMLYAKLKQNVNIGAVAPQVYGGYKRVWNSQCYWQKTDYSGNVKASIYEQKKSFSAQSDDDKVTYKAFYKKAFNISFNAKFIDGTIIPANINIKGIDYVSPNIPNLEVIDGAYFPVIVNASFENNCMQYSFVGWYDENNTVISTNSSTNIYPYDNHTYTAYYTGTPVYSTDKRNLIVTNPIRANPVLTWNEHQNSLVTSYKIYRKVLKGINADPGSLIAEVPKGTHTYTDGDYYNNGTQNQDELFYDVDAYCGPAKTSSPQYWTGIYYGILIKGTDSSNVNSINLTRNFDNSLDNYPNPFNPVTQIRYSLKENGFVSLQIYDILGNKVADLVNEYKPVGSYTISFDASDKPSGIYICTIKTNNYSATKKMLLIK